MKNKETTAGGNLGAALQAGQRSASFATALFKHTAAKPSNRDKNVFLSPFSVGTALALAMQGAQGETANQLKLAVGYGPHDEPEKIHHEVVNLVTQVRSFSILPCFLPASVVFFSHRLRTAGQSQRRRVVCGKRAVGRLALHPHRWLRGQGS